MAGFPLRCEHTTKPFWSGNSTDTMTNDTPGAFSSPAAAKLDVSTSYPAALRSEDSEFRKSMSASIISIFLIAIHFLKYDNDPNRDD